MAHLRGEDYVRIYALILEPHTPSHASFLLVCFQNSDSPAGFLYEHRISNECFSALFLSTLRHQGIKFEKGSNRKQTVKYNLEKLKDYSGRLKHLKTCIINNLRETREIIHP